MTMSPAVIQSRNVADEGLNSAKITGKLSRLQSSLH